jgi:mercuric ion transport protein
MKKLFLFIVTVMILGACGTSAPKDDANAEKETISVENLVEVTFNVEGMTCEGCENAVTASVESLDGIAEVKSSHAEKWTKVSYDKTATSPEEIKTKIADAGYVVEGMTE